MSCPANLPAEAPARSAEQRREALARANQVRHQRACLKADLKRGSLSIATIIMDPPEYLATAHVLDVIMALPRYGHMRATALLERCRVSPRKTIGDSPSASVASCLRRSGSNRSQGGCAVSADGEGCPRSAS
jgi:hypothetical protein